MKRILLFTMMCLFGLFSLNAQTTITVGDGADESSWAQSYNTPVDVYANYGMSQQIYLADEIASAGGAAGTITQIAFKRAPNSGIPTRNWSIYLTNITEGVFDNEQDWTASSFIVSDSDKVYSGNFDIAPDWNVFDLSDFEYTGGNLLVTVVDNTGTNGGDVFWYNHANTSYAIAATGGQFSPENNSYSLSKANRCYIQLTFAEGGEGGETPEPTPTIPAAPEVTAEALSATEIFITWDAVDGATSYNIYFNDEVFTTTETEYTVGNLTANTNYVITVTAVNEAGESEHSVELEVLTYDEEGEEPVAQQYRVKLVSNTNNSVGVGQYLTIESYAAHANGPAGGVALKDYEESNAQIFTLEDAGNNTYYFRSADGYYIYCQSWNVDAYSTAYDMTALGMTDLGDGTFYLMNGTKHFKVEYVNNSDFNVNGNYPFCDASTASTTWTLEEVDNGETPDPTPDPEPEPGDLCVVEFELIDSYGDGWNGATLTVEATDGTSQTLVLTNGKTANYTIEIAKFAHVVVTFNKGTYDSECSFNIRYQGGSDIHLSPKMQAGQDYTFEFDVDCTPKAPDAPVVKTTVTGQSTVLLTWDVVSGATSYNVYRGTEALATALTETSYTVEGLEAATEYCFFVTAFNEVGESEQGEACATTLNEGDVLVSIGEEAISMIAAPVYDAGPGPLYSLSQQIYTNEEIGLNAGVIKSIAFNQTAGNNNVRNITVYMQNVEKASYVDAYDWVAFSDADIVYQGEFNFGKAGDWVTIEFPNGFEYTGDNLLVSVYDATGTAFGYNYDICDKFSNSTINEWRGMFLTKQTELDLTNLSQYYGSKMNTGNYGTPPNYYYVNNIRLVVAAEEGETPTPSIAAPQNLVATVNGQNSITLTWDAVEGAEDYYVYKDGTMWANTSGATTYTEEGLAAGTECCFAVQAAGAAGESELSAEVCATTESVQLAENEIVIGVGTTKYYSPFLTILGGGSWFEAIYKSEEIGKACTISELAFSYKDGNETSADINIYLAETTKDEYANPNDATAESELTLVYSGTAVTLCDEEWETFVLNAPFNYSGENNLVVVVTTANTGLANNWNCYEDANSVLIKDVFLDSKKPVLKLTLGEGGEGGDDEPAEITHRLVGIYQNEWNNVAYTYESETSNVVTEVVSGSYKTLLEYNEDGQIVKTTYAWVDPSTGEMDLSNYTLVTYTYEDGVLVSYKEEIINSWYPSSTEYTFTYEEDFVVKEWPNAKETYAFEDGRLVEKSRYYYDQWAETPDFVKENMVKYEYDENGNCVTETQYSTYGEEPREQNGVDYYYDMTIAAENVATFAYPHEFLPTHANLVTKALLYYYQEDWQTHEVSKSNFEVKTYNYSPEVAAAPFAPMELKANVVSDVEISLTWVSIEAAESFNVYCNGELAGNATETYFSVTGLTAATEYCFTVKGVSAGVESEASNEACATTMQLVNIVPNAIAFGDVKMGEFWTETSTGVEVKIDLLGKTITSIATDNDFFRVPATINLNEEPITFKVDYKKGAEAGEYTGNLVVTLSTEETVTIPLSATAYNPVAPDVFELAQEIEFVEGAYTDAPDFATLHDDYNLPNEAEGNNPDAVYTFTLDTESVVNVEVTGENAVYATYKAFGEEEGPTAANAFFGEETILSTSFSYDFESADLSDFTIVDNDEFKDYTWTVENGSLVSYSFVYDYETYAPIANDADERLITNKAYAITANSVLTLDINVNGSGGNFNFGEAVFIEVTQDGETFTQVGVAYDDETTYSYEFMSKRINIGAKFAELGLEYGEYQIVLHHDQTAYGAINVDNLALTERANVYPAGTYYLVAAASSAFEVNVEVATQEMPVAPKAYRLASKENHATTTYVYDATDVNRVVKIESEGLVDVLEYNTDGTLAGYKTIATYEDPELGNVEEEVGAVSYVYENGRIVSYSETVQTWQGSAEVQTEITYNAEGKVETVLCADYETVSTFAYNAEGLVSEMATGYLWDGEAIVDSKEVYTYENGKLVKLEYMAYDYSLDDGSFYVAEEVVYTYDENGNCVKAETYSIELDEETEEEVRSLYKTVESYYNTTVLAEDVYTFEYPHFVFTYPAKPSSVNVLTKDMSFMTGYDFDGNYGNHSHVLTVYNYDPQILSAPYAPFNLTAEATGESTVALTWEAYADAETFVVYNGTEKVAEGIEGFEYTVEGLAAATEYCFTVKAVNAAGGESLASNEACATTEESAGPTVPAAPVVTAEVLETTILLTWEAVEGATSYSLYSKGELVKANFPDTAVEVAVPAAGTYCFTVTASNEVGESEHSEEVCATVTVPEGFEVPAAPVVTAKLEGNKAVLSWETVEGALFYTVYYEGKEVGDTQNLSASMELSEFGEYCFTVTATNIAGESEHSNEVCVIYGDGVEENEVAFNIYPNPVENVLFIETEMNVEEVSIYTVTGTLIYKEVDFNSNTIDVSEFNGGVYIMKIRTENGETVKRFVKK